MRDWYERAINGAGAAWSTVERRRRREGLPIEGVIGDTEIRIICERCDHVDWPLYLSVKPSTPSRTDSLCQVSDYGLYTKQGCQADGALFQGSSRSFVLKRPFSPGKEAEDRESTAFNAGRCLTSPYMVEVVSGKCSRHRFNHDS
jgi:hypothetical protein